MALPPPTAWLAETVLPLDAPATHRALAHSDIALVRAARNALPMPRTVVLAPTAFDAARAQGLLSVADDGTVTVTDAPALFGALGLPAFGSKTIRVWAAHSSTPPTLFGIDPTKAKPLTDALAQAWSSVPGDAPRHLLLQATPEAATHTGWAATERAYEDDVVRVLEGAPDARLGALPHEGGEPLLLPKLRRFERSPGEEGMARTSSTWQGRLQTLLRCTRDLYGDQHAILWTDDGTTTHLLAVAPLTTPAPRQALYIAAGDLALSLPTRPSRLTTSVLAQAARDIYAAYRSIDADLPAQRDLVRTFDGVPYLNASLLGETMRALGLPTDVATDGVRAPLVRRVGASPLRLAARPPAAARWGVVQAGAVRDAARASDQVLARTLSPGNTFSEALATLRWLMSVTGQQNAALNQAAGVPLLAARRTGQLNAVAAEGALDVPARAMLNALDALRATVTADPALRAHLAAGDVPTDDAFGQAWARLLAEYGHRAAAEGDVAAPRQREDTTLLRAALLSTPWARPAASIRRGRAARLARPLWRRAARVLTARAAFAHQAAHGYDRVRTRLLSLAHEAVARGQLPTPDALWQLDADEAALLDLGWQPPADFWPTRHADANAAADALPPLLVSADATAHQPVADVAAPGVRVGGGQVRGKAWVVTGAPTLPLPDGFTPAETILVARTLDVGWVPVLANVGAVALDSGGDLAEAATLLRALGVPGIIGLGNATQVIATGDPLLLDADTGRVVKQNALAVRA